MRSAWLWRLAALIVVLAEPALAEPPPAVSAAPSASAVPMPSALPAAAPAPAPSAASAPSAAPPPSGPAEQAARSRAPVLPPSLGQELEGRPIVRVEVVVEGGRFGQPTTVTRVRAGQVFSAEAARRALQELTDSGRFADVKLEVEEAGAGVILRLRALPRRVVARLELSGSPIPDDELLRAAGLHVGDDLTGPDLPRVAERMQEALARRGFPRAVVTALALDTDDPLNIVVTL